MRFGEQVQKFLVICHVCASEEKRLLEDEPFRYHPAADLLCPFFVRGEIVVLEVHVLEAELLIHPQLLDDAVDAALAVRCKHPGRRAERASERAAARREDVCRFDLGLKDRIVGERDLVQILDRDAGDEPVFDAALDDVEYDLFPFAGDDLVGVLERLLRHRGHVHATHKDARAALLVDHVGELIRTRCGRCDNGKTEYVCILQEFFVIYAAVEFLVDLYLVSRALQDPAEDQRTGDRIILSVDMSACSVEGHSAKPGRGCYKNDLHFRRLPFTMWVI